MTHCNTLTPPMALAIACLANCTSAPQSNNPSHWRKGNTHTHTYWSDGNAAPDQVVAWYVDHDYDFLVLSDHNIMQTGDRWFPVSDDGGRPLRASHIDQLRSRFGADWVDLRERDGKQEMRLKTLPELQAFAASNGLVLIPGEEVTDHWKKHEVHINAINNSAVIPPQRGESVRDTMQRNLDAIAAHGRDTGRPVLAHVNHPNFVWSLTPEDIASMRGERFFEVYNGHRSVHNEGDASHPSMDELWDSALVARLAHGAGDGTLLYAVATDDAHNHHGKNLQSISGRGWIMVHAHACTADALIAAMRRGDFYASTGVTLRDVHASEDGLALSIEPDGDATFTTEFIGVRRSARGDWTEPMVLATVYGTDAAYEFTGDELYVRGRVTSSAPHLRPYREGDRQMAWVQPLQPR